MNQILRVVLVVQLALLGGSAVQAQVLDAFVLRTSPEVSLPFGHFAQEMRPGLGLAGDLRLNLPALGGFQPLVAVGYRNFSTVALTSFGVTTYGAGLGYVTTVAPRLGIGAHSAVGVYSAVYTGDPTIFQNLFVKAGVEASYRFSPSLAVHLGSSYLNLLGKKENLFEGLTLDLSISLSLAGLRDADNLQRDKAEFDQVFPVLYSQYDRNRIGRFRFTNREDGDIQNVRVSFFAKQFMERPKESAKIDNLPRGESTEVDLYALFNTDVLKLTEATKTLGEVIVEYEFLGVKRTARFEEPIKILNRNALNWTDDRKAAAFVSSKDPAVLQYSKYMAGLIREFGIVGLNQNLRYALGLFEGLKVLELNYVIDPTTPYADFAGKAEAVDFLQFPFQTLRYHGGDCDDLSILYSSMLESVGVKSAFITVPGHIYTALSLDMTEAEARETFANFDDLIVINDNVWMPVEVTLLKDGFQKAWAVGAQQWRDNRGAGRLLPMSESWKIYDPVGPPDQDIRLNNPPTEKLAEAFKAGQAKFVALELPSKEAALQAEITKSGNDPRLLNRLGILHARFGLYAKADNDFAQAVAGGFAPARNNRANVLFLMRNYKEARRVFLEAKTANPEDATAMIGLARTEYELQNYAEAAKWYEMAVGLSPDLAKQYFYLSAKRAGEKQGGL